MTGHKRILIVLGFISPGILAGFTRYAREAGWILNILPVIQGAVPSGWRADGMLCTNVFRPDLLRFVRDTARRVPTVLHGCDDFQLRLPNVECDELAVGRWAAEHLLEQGHRHFAYLHYSRHLHALRRREGFRAALAAAGYACLDLEKSPTHGAGLDEWFGRRLARLPLPLGLFVEDDIAASMAIEATLEAGRQVPRDLAVVGVGDQQALGCEQSQVPLTTIETPFEAQAYRAAAMLDDLLSGKPLKQRTIVFAPTRLIARQSTNAVAARREIVQRAIGQMRAQLQDPRLDMGAIARGCGVSLRLLYKEFAKDLNATPLETLTRMRLRKAKELLTSSRGKIGSIAETCGFANLRTFQRAFHRLEGQSALRWRQGMKDRP